VKRISLLPCTIGLALLILTAAACKSGSPTPTAAFETYLIAIHKEDVTAFKSVLKKSDLAQLDQTAKGQNKTVDGFIKELLGELGKQVPRTVPEHRNERISGNAATLDFVDGNGFWKTMSFVKEDGGWKINGPA
jgi:hypothetical protein